MTDQGIDAGCSDRAVERMVALLEPDWTVEAIERSDQGTDFVAFLDVATPEGDRHVVLKATTADLVEPQIARAEPRLLELVGDETTIPVPDVYGACEAHDDLPAPFTLLEYVEGAVFENRVAELSAGARERICRDAGRHLAQLHDLGALPAAGRIGVAGDGPTAADSASRPTATRERAGGPTTATEGDLGVLDSDEHPCYDDPRVWLQSGTEATLDAIETGGWFPDLADEPERFADLVPDLRATLRERIGALPDPDPPTYCHHDYRYGNLLVDPETGATNAVIDWANLASAPPAYNLASAESLLLSPDRDPPERTAELRDALRAAYTAERPGWTFDGATDAWLDVCHLTCRLDAMACLPLWHRSATPTGRDERAAEHRAFVREYL